MKEFESSQLKNLYTPPQNSHKGENGKLLLIGGSKLFHAASLWSLGIASKIVDMVYYSSVDENNQIVQNAKEEFRNGIIVPRNKIEDYVQEADCILIGPGLPRKDGEQTGDDDTKGLTESLLKKYSEKKWVIDGGSLQTIDPQLIPKNAIVTPHLREFKMLFGIKASEKNVIEMAKKYNIVIVAKGPIDYVCSSIECVQVAGGNAGMTKGGTGDVLAGLIAALYCKNDDPFLAAAAGSFINKKAGENLFAKRSYYFNASDLVDEIPTTMKDLITTP